MLSDFGSVEKELTHLTYTLQGREFRSRCRCENLFGGQFVCILILPWCW